MVVELEGKASALLVVATNEVGEQLTSKKRRHVAEGVTEVEVDVVDLDLGQSQLNDALGADGEWIGPAGGKGHLIRPSVLREGGSFDEEASRGLDNVSNDHLSRARHPGDNVGLARLWRGIHPKRFARPSAEQQIPKPVRVPGEVNEHMAATPTGK
jgi:hypothetical protein